MGKTKLPFFIDPEKAPTLTQMPGLKTTILTGMKAPANLDWQVWVARYDKMQERYVVKRNERYRMIVRLLREMEPTPMRILDLGCATGTLMLAILEGLPQAEVIGIDHDPTVLWLSKGRLERFGSRCSLVQADVRDRHWTTTVQKPLGAVVSSHTIHTFEAHRLSPLYRQIAEVLAPGGVFLNADHVRSASTRFQRAWERLRAELSAQETHDESDDWDGFWNAYSEAIGLDTQEIHRQLAGPQAEGKRERLPLVWHLNRLLESGFDFVDCFWRCDYDAIYGGEKS